MANTITIVTTLILAVILTIEAASNCEENEVRAPCLSTCPASCENKDQPSKRCRFVCNKEGSCVCKQGYVRGWNRKCIKPEECPTCEGANEFYSCGSACDTTCATLNERCPIVNIKCNEKCYCREGFARDETGSCIPVENCPAQPKQCETDPNAFVTPCGDPCPVTCQNKDKTSPGPCRRICIRDGCKCKKGFVQNNDGMCILPSECPDSIS